MCMVIHEKMCTYGSIRALYEHMCVEAGNQTQVPSTLFF